MHRKSRVNHFFVVAFQLSFWGHRDGWRVWPLRLNMKYVSFKGLGSRDWNSSYVIYIVARNRLIDSSETVAKAKKEIDSNCGTRTKFSFFFYFAILLDSALILETGGTLLHFVNDFFLFGLKNKKEKKKDVDALFFFFNCLTFING
jgi:hypothetical protein